MKEKEKTNKKLARNNIKNNEKAITLVALVVTIIVLLILAGISISMLSGDNGILQKATDAKERTTIAQEEENAKLTFTEVQMELSQGKSVDNNKFQHMVDENYGSNKATGTIGGNTYIITVARTGINYQMDSNGNIGTLDELPIDFAPGVLEQNGNTYTINSIEDLVAFSYNVNSGTQSYEGETIALGRNLDFQDDNSYVNSTAKYLLNDYGYSENASGTAIQNLLTDKSNQGFVCIGNGKSNGFNGLFDGKGYSISNIYMNSSDFGGLFGSSSNSIEILDLKIIECDIKAQNPVGALVGICNNTSVYNCFASGIISGSTNVGGLIGYTNNGKIYNSYNNVTVTSNTNAGGIVAWCSGEIVNCYNKGNVSSVENYYSPAEGCLGGVMGSGTATIINCYNFRFS